MNTKLLSITSLLHARFTKAEVVELETQPRFVFAMKAAKTPKSFERLCEAAEELLKVTKTANPAARQFRYGSKQQSQSSVQLRV